MSRSTSPSWCPSSTTTLLSLCLWWTLTVRCTKASCGASRATASTRSRRPASSPSSLSASGSCSRTWARTPSHSTRPSTVSPAQTSSTGHPNSSKTT
uniref:Putative secreted protein n=1 Tax=Ixodes scapularis TaxID=6945 RepID=A0A4D5RAG2_IXOSC